jgi:hypothetical protein
MQHRVLCLTRFLMLESTPREAAEELAAFSWDSDESVEFSRGHVLNVLNKYLVNEVNSTFVEAWANFVEGREDLSFETNAADTLRAIIFELANPVLQGNLTRLRASEMVNELQK